MLRGSGICVCVLIGNTQRPTSETLPVFLVFFETLTGTHCELIWSAVCHHCLLTHWLSFSLVQINGGTFSAFGAVNKGLVWQYVVRHKTMSMLACSLNIYAIL